MERREYLINLVTSPGGMAIDAAAVAVGIGVGLSSGPALGVVAGAATYAAVFTVVTISGLGSRMASAEADRHAWSAAKGHLAAAKASRDRLASMRVPDQEIKALLELAATRGAAYLAACETARSRDPVAEDALAECVSIADLYLKELDGAATERRYGLADADPFADARARTAAALRDKAAMVEKAALDLSGGLSPADRMGVKESL